MSRSLMSIVQPWPEPGITGETIRPQSVEALQAWFQENPLATLSVDRETAQELDYPRWLDMSALQTIRWYSPDDLSLTVETGMTLETLQAALAVHNQYWPFQSLPDTRLIDFLNHDGPGLEAGFCGFPRDWVLGTEVLTGSGVLSHAGGQVVKNVTGYDLNQLIMGSRHSLGVLTAVTIKCLNNPEVCQAGLVEYDDLTDAFRFVDRLLRQSDGIYRSELVQASRLDARRRRRDAWLVWFELRGDQALVNTLSAVISEYSGPVTWQSAKDRQEISHQLMTWPLGAWVFEWAFPPAASLLLCRELANAFGPLERPLLQTRPAAGLMVTIWSDWSAEHELKIQAILKNMAAVGLTIQLLQSPENEGYGFWNLPQEHALLTWNQKLKQLYDPANRLRYSKFPLETR